MCLYLCYRCHIITFVRWYFNHPFLAHISAKRLGKENVNTQRVSCQRLQATASMFFCVCVFIQPSLSSASSCQSSVQGIDPQCSSTKWTSVHTFFAISLILAAVYDIIITIIHHWYITDDTSPYEIVYRGENSTMQETANDAIKMGRVQ